MSTGVEVDMAALIALANDIRDPAVNRPGIRRRREWADRLMTVVAIPLESEPEFPTDHPSTCWCDGKGWRNFGYGPVVCNMNPTHLREVE